MNIEFTEFDTFIFSKSPKQMRVLEEVLALLAGIVENDASPLVRREIALGLEEAVTERKADFNALVESGSKESIASDAAQSIISILLILESDPHPIVSGITRRINSVVNFLGRLGRVPHPHPASTGYPMGSAPSHRL